MKIVFATGVYPPDLGGPATYVSHLALTLHRRGDTVKVVTYGSPPAAPTSPFPVHYVPRGVPLPLRYLRYLATLRRVGRGADLLYLQDPLSCGLPGLLAARSLHCPVLVKVVGDLAWEIATEMGRVKDTIDEFQNRKYDLLVETMRRVEHTVARRADRLLVPSKYLKRLVLQWGLNDKHIEVIENALPHTARGASVSRTKARKDLGLDCNPLLITAGRLVPWKGFDLLIRLMPEIRLRLPQARLLIVGTGPCEARLKDLAREIGAAGIVTFTGSLDASMMDLHLRASDVLLLASTYEGFSHLLLEAMRAEVPILATDIGGNRELMEDGRCGRLVPSGEPGKFLEALVEMCASSSLRARYAEAGVQRFRMLSWDRLVEATTAVLEAIIEAR